MNMNFSQISQYHKINTSIYTENTVQYLIMREEDKLYFAALFGNLEKKVEVMAEEQKAKFAEVGSQLTHYGETLMKMKNEMASEISEVKSSVNANVANISANTSAIAMAIAQSNFKILWFSLVELDSGIKHRGYRQSWWATFGRLYFLRGWKGGTPVKKFKFFWIFY